MDGSATVVRESAGSRNVLWGFLTVVFGVALVRGHLGAETSGGRIAVDAVVGTLFLLCLLGWIYFNRHPAHLEVSPDAIVLRHRGQTKEGTRLPNTGPLYVSRTMFGGKPVAYLRVAGSDEAILMGSFRLGEIQQATLAAGWTWGERPT